MAMIMGLATMPEDMLYLIIELLDFKSALRMSCICRGLHQLFTRTSTWLMLSRVLAREIPLPELSTYKDASARALRDELRQYYRFHAAWTNDPNQPVETTIVGRVHIRDRTCMCRILPGGKYIVLVTFAEEAQFYEIPSGKLVGVQQFTKISNPEVIYSIDFHPLSPTTVAWGLLTSDNFNRPGLEALYTDLYVRIIIIKFPTQLGGQLQFNCIQEWKSQGIPGMLSICNEIVTWYEYRGEITPELGICHWAENKVARHHVKWAVERENSRNIGNPSLHASPGAILLLGGQVGLYRVHPVSSDESVNKFSQTTEVLSSDKDLAALRHSSQGRCSKQWNSSKIPWHRLVTSPLLSDDQTISTVQVFTFELPANISDEKPRTHIVDLGSYTIVEGNDPSPRLSHISRYGSKAMWLCYTEGEVIELMTTSLPSFEAQLRGDGPGPVKRINFGNQVELSRIHAFDMDETAPLLAIAEDDVLWFLRIP